MRILSFTLPLMWLFVILIESCGEPSSDNTNSGTDTPQVIVPPFDTAKSQGHLTDTAMMHSMNVMIKKMNDLMMTPDFDLDYTKVMIIHHQGSIELCQIEIAKGDDKDMRAIALRIMSRQSQEIKKLEDALGHHKHKDETGVQHQEIRNAMNEMKTKMNDIKLTGNTDKDFAKMMIPQHEGSVDMCTEEVINGHHVQLKLMSRDMIKQLQSEISSFKTWLSSH